MQVELETFVTNDRLGWLYATIDGGCSMEYHYAFLTYKEAVDYCKARDLDPDKVIRALIVRLTK